MTLPLTESLEDYLEAIAELVAVEGRAHVKEIAGKLNVKMLSVGVNAASLECELTGTVDHCPLGGIAMLIASAISVTFTGRYVSNAPWSVVFSWSI